MPLRFGSLHLARPPMERNGKHLGLTADERVEQRDCSGSVSYDKTCVAWHAFIPQLSVRVLFVFPKVRHDGLGPAPCLPPVRWCYASVGAADRAIRTRSAAEQ